jgi:hypothetical protein
MNGYIIAYRLPKGIPNKAYTKFQKKFFGQDTSSHNGKYRYRRTGLLDEIPHVKLIRGVLIIDENNLKRIIDFLEEYHVEIHTRKIELSKEDCKILTPSKE